MIDIFTDIRKEHTLTNNEVELFSGIGIQQNKEYEEGFTFIEKSVLELRDLVNTIEAPQKASEEKKFHSNQKKTSRMGDQLSRIDGQIESQREKIRQAELKIEQLELRKQDINDQLEIIEDMQMSLGPERLDHFAMKYFEKLAELCDLALEFDELLKKDNKSIQDILPFITPYMEEYLALDEQLES